MSIRRGSGTSTRRTICAEATRFAPPGSRRAPRTHRATPRNPARPVREEPAPAYRAVTTLYRSRTSTRAPALPQRREGLFETRLAAAYPAVGCSCWNADDSTPPDAEVFWKSQRLHALPPHSVERSPSSRRPTVHPIALPRTHVRTPAFLHVPSDTCLSTPLPARASIRHFDPIPSIRSLNTVRCDSSRALIGLECVCELVGRGVGVEDVVADAI